MLLENFVTGKQVLLKKFTDTDNKIDEKTCETLKRLDHHGLVKVFSAERLNINNCFFLMNFVEGKNLNQVIEENPFSFEESQVLLWLEQMVYPV